MKQGLNIQQLAEKLYEQKKAKRDFVAHTDLMELEQVGDGDGGRFRFVLDNEPFKATDHFHRQLGTHAGIPAKYYDRMKVDAPELLVQNVNHWLRDSSKKRLIRTMHGTARAFLSDGYRPIDNFDLAEAVLPALTKADAKVVSCDVTEKKMYIKAILPDVNVEIPPAGVEEWEWGKGHHTIDVLQPGVVVGNSEIGVGAMYVAPGTNTKKCSNLAVFSEGELRKAHLGKKLGTDGTEFQEVFSDNTRRLSDEALWAQVADMVRGALTGDLFKNIVDQIKASRGLTIEGNPVKTVECLQDKFNLVDAERDGVMKHLIEGGDLTAYGLSNAVTRAAQDVESYDRASDLERVGAQIIELKRKDWNVLAQAA